MKRISLICLIVISIVLYSGLAFAQSKQIFQEVWDICGEEYPDNDEDGDGVITFSAWIEARPEIILTNESPGSRVGMDGDNFFAQVNVGNFQAEPPWAEDEILHIEVYREATNHIAHNTIQLTRGSAPMILRRTDEVDNSITLRNRPVALFDSNLVDDDDEFIHQVATTANLLEGFDPNEDGVYRANDWGQANRYWQIEFSTLGASEIRLESQMRRQFETDIFDDPVVAGPRFMTTYYSTDGEEWTPYGNPEEMGDDQWWQLPNNDNWVPVFFELPEALEDEETVYIRWQNLNDWPGLVDNGWGEIKDVVVSGDQWFDLRVDIQGRGSTYPEADSTYTLFGGTEIELIAEEDTEGWIFRRWVINGADYDTTHVSLTMDRDIEATARFIQFPSPHPTTAFNPVPPDDTTGVSLDLEELRWTYEETYGFVNPLGFRVYMNTTGEFGEDDDFAWVPYVDDQELYSTSEVLPEELEVATTYYWTVIPTTEDPNGRSDDNSRQRRGKTAQRQPVGDIIRGDAEDCPVWSFTTELLPNPAVAQNPRPEHNAANVSIEEELLRWDYVVDTLHTNPIGFRVYASDTPEFNEEEFEWVEYNEDQVGYQIEHGIELEYATHYYWQVVPTTIDPNGQRSPAAPSRTRHANNRIDHNAVYRGDAEDCPIWRFTTGPFPYPNAAHNPNPEDEAENVAVELEKLAWSFQPDTLHSAPLGFRVYTGTDPDELSQHGAFIEYEEGQEDYYLSRTHAPHFEYDTTYYWMVVPTTTDPDDNSQRSEGDRTRSTTLRSHNLQQRGDAQDPPVWSFTTEPDTSVDEETQLPLVTQLQGNYPNPFNPTTTIRFAVAEPSNVNLEVFNSRGQRVITLIDSHFDKGNHQVVWNGIDSNNNIPGSGLYFYRMTVVGQSGSRYQQTDKMLLIK